MSVRQWHLTNEQPKETWFQRLKDRFGSKLLCGCPVRFSTCVMEESLLTGVPIQIGNGCQRCNKVLSGGTQAAAQQEWCRENGIDTREQFWKIQEQFTKEGTP